MASQNSGEDENYWPGYVDALTTMTMVLTFIMMVLGILVFLLSQDLVSSRIGIVARALKMDSRQLEKLTPEEIEEALRRAAARKDDGPGIAPQQSGPEPGGEGQALLSQDGGLIPHGKGRQLAGVLSSRPHEEQSPFETTFDGGMSGDRFGGPGGDFYLEGTGTAGAETGTGTRAEAGPGALRFVFARNAIDPPPEVNEVLAAYVAAEGRAPLLVEARAVASEGGPTAARRNAYFRAMLIRSRLVRLGVDPTRITVRVTDEAQVSARETVDVMRRPADG